MVSLLNKRVLSLFILLGLFLASTPALAQVTPNFSSGISSGSQSDMSLPEAFPQIQEQLDVTITPEAPKSGDSVTISVEAYDTDLNTKVITWTLNGKQILKGYGQKVFTFVVGQSGTITNVSLSIDQKYGTPLTRNFSFSPVDVDVLWQANTYTPPFYKGKALYTPEANVMFVAMPNIVSGSQTADPSNVVYTWKLDYDVQGSLSGFGKNTFNFDGPIFVRPTYVEAKVYSAADPSRQGVNGVTIIPESPTALLYEDNPLLGILFNKAVPSGYSLRGTEVRLAAYPYFFSTQGKNSTVSYSWLLNSSPLTTLPTTQNDIILRKSDSGLGESVLEVFIDNESKILQEAGVGVTVTY